MKSIVVYRIIIVSWFIILAAGLAAQKPAIDLISSHHQYRHPEAIIDTGYTVNPPVRDAVLIPVSKEENQNLTRKSKKRRKRQIGPSLDSLFQKEEIKSPESEKTPIKTSILNKRYNPIKFLIYIAIK